MFFSLRQQPVTSVLLISVLVQLSAFSFFAVISQQKNLAFPVLTGDANHYRTLAENLLQKKAFDTFSNMYSPEIVRTPGYPLFLAVLFYVFRNWTVVALAQALLLSLLPVLIYLFGTRLIGERVGWWAAILSSLDPNRLFFSSVTLSDMFFSFVLLASIYYFFVSTEKQTYNWKSLGLAGLLLGYAILTRPVAQFIPLLLLVVLFIRTWPRLQFFKAAAIFLVAVLLVVSPWMLRNKILFNTYQLATVGPLNMGYFAMLYLEQHEGVSAEQLRNNIGIEAGSEDPNFFLKPAANQANMNLFFSVLRDNPIGYPVFHVVKTIPFFLNDGVRDFLRIVGLPGGILPNLSGMFLHGDVSGLLRAFSAGGRDTALLILGSGILVLISFFALLGAIVGMTKPQWRVVAVTLAIIILYFAVLTGPVANARYRMPVMGFLLILASLGLNATTDYVRIMRNSRERLSPIL